MKYYVLSVVFVLVAVLVLAARPDPKMSRVVRVKKVIGGSTLVIIKGEKVRLLGLNIPEQHDPDTRKQRTLAWVKYGPKFSRFLNAEIIREGYGFSDRKKPTHRQDEFNRLEAEARRAKRGLWAPGVCKDYKAQPASSGDSKVVYITKTGCCYHRKSCSRIKNKEVRAVNKDVAVKRGRRACKVCKP